MNDLYKLTATDAVALLKNRDVSPLDLVEASIERIDMTDARLNAMVTRCYERARDHARRLLQDKPRSLPANFLYGLPIAAKDNLDVAGVRSTFGSKIHADRIAPESDLIV